MLFPTGCGNKGCRIGWKPMAQVCVYWLLWSLNSSQDSVWEKYPFPLDLVSVHVCNCIISTSFAFVRVISCVCLVDILWMSVYVCACVQVNAFKLCTSNSNSSTQILNCKTTFPQILAVHSTPKRYSTYSLYIPTYIYIYIYTSWTHIWQIFGSRQGYRLCYPLARLRCVPGESRPESENPRATGPTHQLLFSAV